MRFRNILQPSVVSVLLAITCIPVSQCQANGEEKLSKAANCFTLKFYKELAKTKGNIVSSPFSLDVLLSMLRVGAGGKTYQDLTTPLGYDDLSVSVMKDAFKSKLSKLTSNNGNTLEVGNSIWIQKKFDVNQNFKNAVVSNFYARIENVDFKNNAPGATEMINRWGNAKTHGLIPKLFGEDLDRDTVMVLVNAIYFKGEWASKFETKNTKDGDFYQDDSKKNPKKVKLMNQLNSFKYRFDKSLNSQILEMDYKGGDMSMILILPDTGSNLNSLEAKFTCANLETALGDKSKSRVIVTMPKFNIESFFDLVKPIKAIGIKDMFSPFANFSGIAPDITVTKAIQKAVIKVYEEGSEAAAITAIGAVRTTSVGGPEPKIIEFRADRPFLYMILNKPTNLILFMGRVNDPRVDK